LCRFGWRRESLHFCIFCCKYRPFERSVKTHIKIKNVWLRSATGNFVVLAARFWLCAGALMVPAATACMPPAKHIMRAARRALCADRHQWLRLLRAGRYGSTRARRGAATALLRVQTAGAAGLPIRVHAAHIVSAEGRMPGGGVGRWGRTSARKAPFKPLRQHAKVAYQGS
jgi:hypothetical protein